MDVSIKIQGDIHIRLNEIALCPGFRVPIKSRIFIGIQPPYKLGSSARLLASHVSWQLIIRLP